MSDTLGALSASTSGCWDRDRSCCLNSVGFVVLSGQILCSTSYTRSDHFGRKIDWYRSNALHSILLYSTLHSILRKVIKDNKVLDR
jgi:hypothetical protein